MFSTATKTSCTKSSKNFQAQSSSLIFLSLYLQQKLFFCVLQCYYWFSGFRLHVRVYKNLSRASTIKASRLHNSWIAEVVPYQNGEISCYLLQTFATEIRWVHFSGKEISDCMKQRQCVLWAKLLRYNVRPDENFPMKVPLKSVFYSYLTSQTQCSLQTPMIKYGEVLERLNWEESRQAKKRFSNKTIFSIFEKVHNGSIYVTKTKTTSSAHEVK